MLRPCCEEKDPQICAVAVKTKIIQSEVVIKQDTKTFVIIDEPEKKRGIWSKSWFCLAGWMESPLSFFCHKTMVKKRLDALSIGFRNNEAFLCCVPFMGSEAELLIHLKNVLHLLEEAG